MKKWRPMLCTCVIEQHADWSGGKSIISSCPAHAHITDPQTLYETCLQESRRAMNVLRRIEDGLPAVYDLTLDGEGVLIGRQFKPGRDVHFSYGTSPSDRTLHVHIAGFRTNELNAVRGFASILAVSDGPIVVE